MLGKENMIRLIGKLCETFLTVEGKDRDTEPHNWFAQKPQQLEKKGKRQECAALVGAILKLVG